MIENNNTYIYKKKIITKTYEKEITEIENKIINIQQNEIDKFLITDLTDYENKKYTSINFSIYFYNRILEKYFNFLKIDINDGTLFITNKNEISKKISADTFKYFNKYPKKIKIINFIIKEVIKKLQYENFEQEMEESSIYPYFFKINELKNIENKQITYSEDIDKMCLIVDRDKKSFKEEQYNYVKEECKRKNFKFYVTNPCFEFWLLLHFDEVHSINREKLLENKRASSKVRYVESELKKYFPYNKNKYNAELLIEKIDLAIENEKRFCEDIEELKDKLGSNIGLLIKELKEK